MKSNFFIDLALFRTSVPTSGGLTAASIGVSEGTQGVMNTAVTAGTLPSGSTAQRLSPAIMNVYSKEILFQAQPRLVFDQFATVRTELGVQPGLTIIMTRFNNLAPGGPLVEGTRIVAQALSASQISITIQEQGNAVSMSELLLRSSFDNIMSIAATQLGFDVAKVLDSQLMSVCVSGTNVVYAGRVANRASVNAGFQTQAVKDGREILAINNAPKIGDSYVCFLHPHQGREIRDDSNWISASEYGASGQLFRAEIGMYEDTRFIETTTMPILTGAGAGVDVYQAVMMGFNAYGLAIGLPVELRDNGVIDYQRERELAWYAIWGTNIITDANLVRIESA
jgi:N4-gp56 family major capsid protein